MLAANCRNLEERTEPYRNHIIGRKEAMRLTNDIITLLDGFRQAH
jgi:hypothetical protein